MPKCHPFHKFELRLRRLAREQRGQALVEFAVLLPVLLLIIMGILYFGRYENYSNQLTQLSAQGARWASVSSDPSTTQSLQSYILSQLPPELQAGANSGDVTPAKIYIYDIPTPGVVGGQVRACIVTSVTYPLLFGLTSATQTMAEYATMRIESLTPAYSSSPTYAGWSPADNSPGATPSQCPLT